MRISDGVSHVVDVQGGIPGCDKIANGENIMGSILDDGRKHYPSKDSVKGRTVNGKRVAVSHGEIRTTKKPKYNAWGEVMCNKHGRVIDHDHANKKSAGTGSIWPIILLFVMIAILLCGAPPE